MFTHTGWRKLEKGWVYLHGGGAIGAEGAIEGICTSLPDALTPFNMPDPPQEKELRDAVCATLCLFTLGDGRIVAPIFCAVWRSALGRCDFSIHLSGPTGVFKTELAALAQRHFGEGFDARHLPGSWLGTGNSLEGLSFIAKDSIMAVDDFAPTGSAYDRQRLHREADRLLRAIGNAAGRSRMRSDASLRPVKPPRSLVLSTGEDIPAGSSLRARMLVIEISAGEINKTALTSCQRDGDDGLYAKAMAGVHPLARAADERGRRKVEDEGNRIYAARH